MLIFAQRAHISPVCLYWLLTPLGCTTQISGQVLTGLRSTEQQPRSHTHLLLRDLVQVLMVLAALLVAAVGEGGRGRRAGDGYGT